VTTDASNSVRAPGARAALVLLLAINLFNYIDRQVLSAVQSTIGIELHLSNQQMGWCASAFLFSYMLLAPIFGWLGDRTSRWLLVGIGVALWSLASGATGLAYFLPALLLTRACVGVGEAAYGPVAPTLLSDLYPVRERGKILSWFYLAIPVGGALGYVVGGKIDQYWGWRWAFFLVTPPGLVLGAISLFMREPKRGTVDRADRPPATKINWRDYTVLLRTPSYLLDTAGMAAMTFAIMGMAFFMPEYITKDRLHAVLVAKDGTIGADPKMLDHVNLIFGGITAVSGLLATFLGGWAGDRLRDRLPGSYFIVSAAGLLMGFPMFLLLLVTPFPFTWVWVFLACCCLFFNTGPSNAILANVTPAGIRATAFAINIFVIHLFGDAISPPVIGAIADRWGLGRGFLVVSFLLVVGGLFWLWGARYLQRDTENAGKWTRG
jgi:MFS family permease